jgi:hypothetical protein
MLKNICRDDIEALDIVDQAVQKPDGKPSKTGNIVTSLGRPEGNSRDKALRRLREHRPDLHAQVVASELSAHAAMIEAGFRPRTFSVPDDIDAAVPILRRRFGDRVPALIPKLSATDVETDPDAEVANGGPDEIAESMPREVRDGPIEVVIGPSEASREQVRPAMPPEPIGQDEAMPKRQHASGKHALASDRRVEDVLNRLAALSPEERALVIDAAVAPPIDEQAAEDDGDNGPQGSIYVPQTCPYRDPYGDERRLWLQGTLQAIGPIADAVSRLAHIPNSDPITDSIIELIRAFGPALIQIPERKRGKIVDLLRSCDYGISADQLLGYWAKADEAMARKQL